eukprot:2443236-Pyramimonas_sp.AAC.1
MSPLLATNLVFEETCNRNSLKPVAMTSAVVSKHINHLLPGALGSTGYVIDVASQASRRNRA